MERSDVNAEERFFAKVVQDGECWRWTGANTGHGYGQFWHKGKKHGAHRWIYRYMVADMGELFLDHLCRNPWCVNPYHLEPVTNAENVRRGRSHWREQAVCKNGHPFDRANAKQRFCSECRRGASLRYYYRHHAQIQEARSHVQ